MTSPPGESSFTKIMGTPFGGVPSIGQRASFPSSSAILANVAASPLPISPCIRSSDEVVVPWSVREHRPAMETSAWAQYDLTHPTSRDEVGQPECPHNLHQPCRKNAYARQSIACSSYDCAQSGIRRIIVHCRLVQIGIRSYVALGKHQ